MINRIKILFFVFTVVIVTGVYSQPKHKNVDVYFCRHDGENIIIDENYTFIDSNYVFEVRNKSMETLVKEHKKEIDNSKQGSCLFSAYEDWQKDFTGIKLGEEFYVSTPFKVFKSDIYGYKLSDCEPNGYDFNPVLNNTVSIQEDTIDYERNYFICSKYSKMSRINYDCITDKTVIKNVTGFLKEYTKNVKVDLGDETKPVTKVFEGNFLNSGEKEYAVSYQGRVTFETFVSGVFIVNDKGKVEKTVIKFRIDPGYLNLLGIVDYNGDGQFELIIESGYYEGSGCELYKLNDGKYEMIASGFYWGA
jgi:hypothetical protein